jgi:ClpP class serine protease
MSLDFSSLFWIFIAIMVLQPLFMGRWYALRRAQAIRAIEKSHASRVITMIHRQEKRSIFGFAVSRHIDLEDAQTIIAAIKDTPDDMPIDLVVHTPGGLVLAAMQIARAVEAHKAKVTVYVPVYAMSGGTLIALAADEIVLGEFSVLGPIDPQIAGLPAASIVKARDSKPVESVSSCSCSAIRSAVLFSSSAPEYAAACSTNSLIFSRIIAMRSSSSIIVGPVIGLSPGLKTSN